MFWQKETEKAVLPLVRDLLRISVLSLVKADRVLVLAPHVDDDVMAAGGLIKMLSAEGTKITAIYFSDGALGNKKRQPSAGLIEDREQEAREAGRILGIGEQRFLRLSDGQIKPNIELAKIIRREIEFGDFDLILSPSFDDPHPEHHAVAEILHQSLKNFDGHLNIWLYETWATGRINRIVVVDDFIDDKISALNCHKSQVKFKPYEESVLALNQYRAYSTASGKYAEGYYSTGVRNYQRLFELLSRHHHSKN